MPRCASSLSLTSARKYFCGLQNYFFQVIDNFEFPLENRWFVAGTCSIYFCSYLPSSLTVEVRAMVCFCCIALLLGCVVLLCSVLLICQSIVLTGDIGSLLLNTPFSSVTTCLELAGPWSFPVDVKARSWFGPVVLLCCLTVLSCWILFCSFVRALY